MIEYIENLHQTEIVGLLFLLVGISILLFNLKIVLLATSSKNWPQTQGEILSSKLNIMQFTGEPKKSFNPHVKYKYTVKGREYESTRIYFGNKIGSSFKKRKSRKVIEKYPIGKPVNVFYNPMKESTSVLETGVKTEPVSLIIVGLVFTIAGYLIFKHFELINNYL
jgi:hypothetical protein